tara:strand:- start:241 stop:528 length:288 start_codon:yes stop_codon:yes gene_type:complete
MEKTFQTFVLLDETSASKIIGAASSSLKQSRHTGMLFGKPSPVFIKMGRSARYKLSELIKFRDQFPEYQNTSQIIEQPNGPNVTQSPSPAGDGHE